MVNTVRQYFQGYFAVRDLNDSSDLPMDGLAQASDFRDPTYPEAEIWCASLYDEALAAANGNRLLERLFLFDEHDRLLGVRSSLDYSLRFGGCRHRLGEEALGLFGTPSATHLTENDDGAWYYSEWFGNDFSSGCDYLYDPEAGTYRLVNMVTSRLDASTNTGIHVGSTVGEAMEVYPGIRLQRGCLALSESLLGPEGCRLELYFSPSDDRNEPLETTRARTITRICISTPTI